MMKVVSKCVEQEDLIGLLWREKNHKLMVGSCFRSGIMFVQVAVVSFLCST